MRHTRIPDWDGCQANVLACGCGGDGELGVSTSDVDVDVDGVAEGSLSRVNEEHGYAG